MGSGVMPRCLQACLLALLLIVPLPSTARTVVLGFDGMDYRLTQQWMAAGELPNFSRLAQEGHFQSLATTNPAQSPVAWSSFATGSDPGEHGIFDFVRRKLENYEPEFSIAELEPGSHWDLFGVRIPTGEARLTNRRLGKPFWLTAEQRGQRSTVLRVPVSFPPDPVHRMLSGMGVPDLIGSQGSFTFYTSRFMNAQSEGGRILRVKPRNGRIESELEGPANPFSPTGESMSLPLVMSDLGEGRLAVRVGDAKVEMSPGEWSDWQTLSFGFGPVGLVEGMVRYHLVAGFPRPQLYVSPINMSPQNPSLPISSPPEYAAELARRIGPYHTLGMPEETWSLNERRIDDAAYLEMVRTVLAEREAMLRDALEREDSELVITVFVQTDRVSHMFWRGIDQGHALFEETDEQARNAIRWIYGEADRILGETRAMLEPEDRLIVLSDHGFADFRWSVQLNRWLIDQGYLVAKPGHRELGPLFEGVDWSRSKAYAMGLNGLFVNQAGREQEGIVPPGEAAALKAEISAALRGWIDPKTGQQVIADVVDRIDAYSAGEAADAPDLLIGYAPGYRASWQTVLGAAPGERISVNRDKWSGDHCIDPAQVPGVLFTSFKPAAPVAGIGDMAELILSSLPATPASREEFAPPKRGLFDHAAPVLNGVKAVLDPWMPNLLQLLLFGALSGWISMLLYGKTSNQPRLTAIKADLTASNKALARYDGEFSGLLPLIGLNYSLATRSLFLTLGPALLASIPLLFLLGWVALNYDARLPAAGAPTMVSVVPVDGMRPAPIGTSAGSLVQVSAGQWRLDWPSRDDGFAIVEPDGTLLAQLPLQQAVDIVHTRAWWNLLFANPNGYLPDRGVIDALEFDFPRYRPFGFGPDWLDAWYAPFFASMVIGSLWLKRRWKLV